MTILPHDTPARLCSSQFRIFLAEINYSVFRALSLFSIVCKYPHVIEKNYERNEKREFIDSCGVICCSSSFCIASHNTNSILRHFNRLKLYWNILGANKITLVCNWYLIWAQSILYLFKIGWFWCSYSSCTKNLLKK